MNSADKSVSLLDVALRRRFALFEVPPDPSVFARTAEWCDEIADVDIGALLSEMNRRLLAGGVEPDRLLGHALFAVEKSDANPLAALRERIIYDIYPLITEYFFLERARLGVVLGDLVDDTGRLRTELDEAEFAIVLKSIVAPTAQTQTVNASSVETIPQEQVDIEDVDETKER